MVLEEDNRLILPDLEGGMILLRCGRGPRAEDVHARLRLGEAALQGGTVDLDLRREGMIVAPALEVRVGSVDVIAVDAPLTYVGEEGGQLVEVPRRDRVELVIVALGAAHGCAHPRRAD